MGLFSTVLVAAFLVLATIELVLNPEELSAFGAAAETPHTTFRYLWVRMASYYLADLLPLASFIAAFITFAWSSRSMELVAIQAGGVRLFRVILPVMAVALILSLAAAVLHETLILRAHQISSSRMQGRHDQPDFGRKSFWYHKGHRFVNIAFADPETRMLHGVEIFERGPKGTIERVIRTDRVRIQDDGVWRLENAAIWIFDPNRPTAQPRVETNSSMTLDLHSLGDDVLSNTDPRNLPLKALAERLDARSDTTSSGLRRSRSLYHQRMSDPWLILAFSWLALPFALRVDRTGRIGGPAIAAVATLGIFFLIQSAGTAFSRYGFIPAGLTPWILIVFVLFGSAIALQRQSI